MKNVLKISGVLLAVIMIAYLFVMNMPKASVKSVEADYKLNSEQLYSEYSTDEESSDLKYLGRVIELSGVVEDITTDEQGAAVVLLGDGDAVIHAIVTMEEDQKSKLSAYQPGQNITVKAKCNGMLIEVALNKGLIVE